MINLTLIVGNEGFNKKKLFELNKNLEVRIQERTAELAYSNERLRVLSEATFEGIVLSENGVIIESNNNLAAIFGFEKSIDLIGMKVVGLVAPEKRKDMENRLSSKSEKTYETLGITKDGRIFPAEVHGKIFSYQGRQVRGAVVRDLTDRKEAEREIQTLRNMLPICSFCKKIRNDKGYWEQIESYFKKHSTADFSHSVCPECIKKHYPDFG